MAHYSYRNYLAYKQDSLILADNIRNYWRKKGKTYKVWVALEEVRKGYSVWVVKSNIQLTS
jgi:hypothetical protein